MDFLITILHKIIIKTGIHLIQMLKGVNNDDMDFVLRFVKIGVI